MVTGAVTGAIVVAVVAIGGGRGGEGGNAVAGLDSIKDGTCACLLGLYRMHWATSFFFFFYTGLPLSKRLVWLEEREGLR